MIKVDNLAYSRILKKHFAQPVLLNQLLNDVTEKLKSRNLSYMMQRLVSQMGQI